MQSLLFVKKRLEETKKLSNKSTHIPEYELLCIGADLKNTAFKIGNGEKSNFLELALEGDLASVRGLVIKSIYNEQSPI